MLCDRNYRISFAMKDWKYFTIRKIEKKNFIPFGKSIFYNFKKSKNKFETLNLTATLLIG